ncbi:unnamed protein product [Rotaria sp. Silwood1]|nr:unnamed protein product [Rotaria sp. Silwood1]
MICPLPLVSQPSSIIQNTNVQKDISIDDQDTPIPTSSPLNQQHYDSQHQISNEQGQEIGSSNVNNNDEFILVKRNKKKIKTNHQHYQHHQQHQHYPQHHVLQQHQHQPDAPTNKNIITTNTSLQRNSLLPSTSPTYSHNHEMDMKNVISEQAIRFAQTRFPFPPIIIKFAQDVNENVIIKSIEKHFNEHFYMDLSIAGHRLKGKRDLILFAGNRESFVLLYDDKKWPQHLNSIVFEKAGAKHLPAQFSIILRNVPIDINIDELLVNIKNDYPDVVNAFRISNKDEKPTTLVRLDIKCTKIIDELLKKKFMYVNNIRYTVTEYISPAKVLVCTKCYQIGHFRGVCKSELQICRTCGTSVMNVKDHQCDKIKRCIRCNGPHEASDNHCPLIKAYRIDLTRSLLSTSSNITGMNQNVQQNYIYNKNDYPQLNGNKDGHPWYNDSLTATNRRLDELVQKMDKLNQNINRIMDFNSNSYNQHIQIHQLIVKQDHDIQLHQIDLSFQHDFVSQFVSPICQLMLDVIPTMIKKNLINDKTTLGQSLLSTCEKLGNELPQWMKRYADNENIKMKLKNDFIEQKQKHLETSNPGNNSQPIPQL